MLPAGCIPSMPLTVLYGERHDVHVRTFTTGQEYVHTVAAGWYERLISFEYIMDTGATGGIRNNGYIFRDPDGNTIYSGYSLDTVGANSQPVFSAGYRSRWNETNNVAVAIGAPMPSFWLWPGCTMETNCVGLTGSEVYQRVNFYIEAITREGLMQHYLRRRRQPRKVS